MAVLPSTTIRTALVDYRAMLIRLNNTYPETFRHTHPQLIAQIDSALMEIEGNITTVQITPCACAN